MGYKIIDYKIAAILLRRMLIFFLFDIIFLICKQTFAVTGKENNIVCRMKQVKP